MYRQKKPAAGFCVWENMGCVMIFRQIWVGYRMAVFSSVKRPEKPCQGFFFLLDCICGRRMEGANSRLDVGSASPDTNPGGGVGSSEDRNL